MNQKITIQGFLHFRTDLGDGTRSGVVFSACRGNCDWCCAPFAFLPEHPFAEDTPEKDYYTAEQLIDYLKEEKVLCYTKPLGITFLGKEPLLEPDFCHFAGYGIKKAGMNLEIHTCADVPLYVFEKLFGICDLYVVRLFSLDEKKHRPYPEFDLARVMENIAFLNRKKIPFRLMIPVIKGVNTKEAASLAQFASLLTNLKSVILDFSKSKLSEDKIKAYRAEFLNRGVVLY
jgi:pyruvate-formate lyase-activating enzyme